MECWIAPNGKIYKVVFGGHDAKALEICQNFKFSTKNPGHELEKRGWLHVGCFVGPMPVCEITNDQFNALFSVWQQDQTSKLGVKIESYMRQA